MVDGGCAEWRLRRMAAAPNGRFAQWLMGASPYGQWVMGGAKRQPSPIRRRRRTPEAPYAGGAVRRRRRTPEAPLSSPFIASRCDKRHSNRLVAGNLRVDIEPVSLEGLDDC